MDSTLKRHDGLMPQRVDGMRQGTALALFVHIGLIVALAFGVSWRSQTPAGVSAELWAAVPQMAAPAAVEPAPVPVAKPVPPPPVPKAAEPPPKPSPTEAQIAIEREKADRLRKEQERKELERLEREKAEKLAAQQKRELEQKRERELEQKRERELEQKRQKEEEARIAKLRDENLKRALGEAGGTGAPSSTGTAAREAGPSASYAGRIIARIKPNIVLTDEIPGNPTASVEVRAGPDGTIIGRRLVKSSGQKAWDDAVLRAIDRTEILPRDTDGRVPGTMVIEFRPRE